MGKMANGADARRRFDLRLLYHSLECRRQLLTATQATAQREAAKQAETFNEIAANYREIAKKVEGLPEQVPAQFLSEAVEIACYLCRYVDGIMNASEGADAALRAAHARATLLHDEVVAKNSELHSMTYEAFDHWLSEVAAVAKPSQVPSVLVALGLLPQPSFYSRAHDPYTWVRKVKSDEATTSIETEADTDTTPIVVSILFSMDGQPLQTAQAVKSGVNYDLTIRAETAIWPKRTPKLHVDYISALNTQDWAFTKFDLEPSETSQHRAEASGHMVVRAAQNLSSSPATFRVRARFLSADGTKIRAATVVGHHELRFHALNADSYPILTHYPVVDTQVVKVLEEARRTFPSLPPSEFDDFERCLVYVARYAGMVLQNGVFKKGNFAQGRIDEKRDFQQHLLQQIRMAMSPDVREGESGSGGLLDLRYHNTVIELKVEYEIKDRTRLRTKYIRQPAQYSITASPLSILCILDMTEKDSPPAHLANNITLETPTQHGFESGITPAIPARVAVVIIDGNTKLPSDYS